MDLLASLKMLWSGDQDKVDNQEPERGDIAHSNKIDDSINPFGEPGWDPGNPHSIPNSLLLQPASVSAVPPLACHSFG